MPYEFIKEQTILGESKFISYWTYANDTFTESIDTVMQLKNWTTAVEKKPS